MPQAFPIDVYGEDLTRVTRDIFATMLGIEVEAAGAEWRPAADRMTAAVYLAGAWRGAVLLECARDQSRQFAARLMSIPPPDSVDDDVRDSLAELANMLAGNLKSLLPPGVALSAPSVVEGSDYTLRLCGGNAAVERLSCSWPGGVFWVTLVELLNA